LFFNRRGDDIISEVFPKPIQNLPEADVPLEGVQAYLAQGNNFQIVFMGFKKDVQVPEHSHEAQWGIVLEGKIDLVLDSKLNTYSKGDRYFIPKGVKHSAMIYAGYNDLTFFNQKDRYMPKT